MTDIASFRPLRFKSAEDCLQLTICSMHLNKEEDRKFLEQAMRTYAALVLEEEEPSCISALMRYAAAAKKLEPNEIMAAEKTLHEAAVKFAECKK